MANGEIYRGHKHHGQGRYRAWNEVPLGEKLNLWTQKRKDQISSIPYWLHVSKVAFTSKHPHKKLIEEGRNPSDIEEAKSKIALTFGVAVLSVATALAVTRAF